MYAPAYRVHGLSPSYFTCKLTGYLDYKGIAWLLRRFPGVSAEGLAAGWSGGIPLVQTPDGEFMWDTTAMIHHLELHHPEPSVFPHDPAQRFLCYVLEDASDEWMYRPAVGTRWHFAENTAIGSVEIARDIAAKTALDCDMAREVAQAHMTSSLPLLGVTGENIQSWVGEVMRPSMRLLGAHLMIRPYLFGERPSLADFAVFGGNAAHFLRDPLCRRWGDEDAPAAVRHMYRLYEPQDEKFGGWAADAAGDETMLALVAELGRFYLPWVSEACRRGSAVVRFASGASAEISATSFLRDARATLLARYVECRSAAVDAVLARAGILEYFADFTADASEVPDYRDPPRPALNRPFPPPDQA